MKQKKLSKRTLKQIKQTITDLEDNLNSYTEYSFEKSNDGNEVSIFSMSEPNKSITYNYIDNHYTINMYNIVSRLDTDPLQNINTIPASTIFNGNLINDFILYVYYNCIYLQNI